MRDRYSCDFKDARILNRHSAGSQQQCDSSGVYSSDGDRQDAGRCHSIFASGLAAQSVAFARSRRSIRKRLRSDADLALTDEELDRNQPYEVVLRLVIATEAGEDDERERLALSVLTELQDLMGQCTGIAVVDAEVKTLNEFSLADFLDTNLWDYEYLSDEQEQEAGNKSLVEGI